MIKLWVFVLALVTASYSSQASKCPANCHCNNTAMECTIDDLNNLNTTHDRSLTSLTLSGGKIKEIPRRIFIGFPRLQFLSLAGNEIAQISNGSFSGLNNLQELVLENNQIHTVLAEVLLPLKSLRYLNLKGNRYKRLPSSILLLPSLEKIEVDNITNCQFCEIDFALNCSSEYQREFRQIAAFGNVSGVCVSWINCQYFPDNSCACRSPSKIPPIKNLQTNSTQFNLSTALYNNSYHNDSGPPSATSVPLIEDSVPLKSFTFILSLVAVLSNLLIVKVVFTTERLKNLKAMFLAGNIAACDFLISSFLLVIAINATILTSEQRQRHIDSWRKYVCPTIISTRSVALLVEPLALFPMTLDRYKLIVHYSRPATHLTRRTVLITISLAWLLSAILVGSQTMGFVTTHEFKSILCGRASWSKNYGDYIEKTGIAGSSVLFLLSCVMYIRIYRVVKTQDNIRRSKAYTRVAKLIFALVLSTLVLWYLPAMIVAFIGHQTYAKEIRQLTIFISFTTNSLVNPFLYVFREKKFRQELRLLLRMCNSNAKTVQSKRKIERNPTGIVNGGRLTDGDDESNKTHGTSL